ncbi:sodium-dependent dopamine transporter-like [Haliotis rufescens]|uniref:sodium-dependent dopamine transporter-like n=1 Tax=Haliotis rufescens TaxID=6454 RepID=UPI00201F04B9|nr:sodium-dependent dopamine transporter-like [Haliotis rufescens]
MFPQLMKRHWLTVGAVLLSLFLFGLIYTSQGGIFVVTLVDWYTFFPSTAVFGILECIVVGWCYGTKRLHEDALTMWGKRIPRAMVISFKFVCPLFLVVICCYSFYSYRPPKYGDYIYPTWATAVGWLISVSSLLPLPTVFIWTVYNTQGATVKELSVSIRKEYAVRCCSSVSLTAVSGKSLPQTVESGKPKRQIIPMEETKLEVLEGMMRAQNDFVDVERRT